MPARCRPASDGGLAPRRIALITVCSDAIGNLGLRRVFLKAEAGPMANTRSSNGSPAAAEAILRQKLRGATTPQSDPPEPKNGEIAPELAASETNGVHANGVSVEAAATAIAAAPPGRNGFPSLDRVQAFHNHRADPT